MRLVHVAAYVFAVFAFLTIGSSMIIVSLHVLTMEDALLKVQDVYESSWRSLQIGATGILFIFAGLLFSKILVKETRSNEEVLLHGKWGYVSVSLKAIEDLVRKTVRRFESIRDARIKTEVNGNRLKVRADVVVLSDWNLSELTGTVQGEISKRISRLIGEGIELEIAVNVAQVIERTVAVGA